MEKKVAVLGAGAWGLAVAERLVERHEVSVWTSAVDKADVLNATKQSPYLKDFSLNPALFFSGNVAEVAKDKDCLIIATPSMYTLPLVNELAKALDASGERPTIGVLTKGFLERDGKAELLLPALEAILPAEYKGNLVYISGPSHAEEVARGVVTGLICASENPKRALDIREIMNSQTLKVYPSLDPIGVQVAGALKNAVAIAFGIFDAMKDQSQFHVGDNTESFLFAVGLNEIQTFGRHMGSTHPETFSSIAGVGDLDVTCRSVHGRNRRFGRSIILENVLENFKNIEDLKANIGKLGYMIEGISACYYAVHIAREKGLRLPLLEALYKLLNKEQKPEFILSSLLS